MKVHNQNSLGFVVTSAILPWNVNGSGFVEQARGNVMFIGTGVTDGSFLTGVRYFGGAVTHSVVMRSQTGTVRNIESRRAFESKPRYGW